MIDICFQFFTSNTNVWTINTAPKHIYFISQTTFVITLAYLCHNNKRLEKKKKKEKSHLFFMSMTLFHIIFVHMCIYIYI